MTGTVNGISDEDAEKRRRIERAAPELLAGCNWFMDQLANGTLVRNTANDSDNEYLANMAQLVRALMTIQKAIDRAEGL